MSKTTCGMKRVPLLSLKNVRTIFTFFLENFFLITNFFFVKTFILLLKGGYVKSSHEKRVYLSVQLQSGGFSANFRPWSINHVVCEILGLYFLGLVLVHTPPKASKNCSDSFCVKKKKYFLFFLVLKHCIERPAWEAKYLRVINM